MFEHYTFGMQARPVRPESRELSPTDITIAVAQSDQLQCPSPPLSPTTPEAARGSGTLPDTIERLALELSRHNLQLDRANLDQLQAQLLSPAPSPHSPCLSPLPPCPELEMDDGPPLEVDVRYSRNAPPLLSPTDSIEVDPIVTDMKRLRRQKSGYFNNNPDNSRTIQTLVEAMIESGSQCNVHRASPPPATPTSAQRLGTILEPVEEIKLDLGMGLEIDDTSANARTSDSDNDERFIFDAVVSLRRAGAPAGVRKLGVLQYRASADAALNCANVVRSRPRMRKRDRAHRGRIGSKASSIVSSAYSTPTIPPSLPDESLIPFHRV